MATAGHPRPGRSAPALVPRGFARAVGFVPLVSLGAHEWAGMSAGRSPARGFAWVAVALAAAVAVIAAARLGRGSGTAAALGAAAAGLVAAALVSGIDPGLLRPARWDDLYAGLERGGQQLGTVRLPYAGADPWPRHALDLAGALLCVLAALLVAWPRASGRGFRFCAWALLMVLVVAPVVGFGGSKPIALGLLLAILTVLFLWLECMPLRPGMGLAVLGGIALVGALPVGLAADRRKPWFDYPAFAERLVPARLERFSWDHDYGPLRWPRERRELLRVETRRPAYLKAETLDTFDGERWLAGGGPQPEDTRPEAGLAASWEEHPEWSGTASVLVRNLGSLAILGPGTLLGVDEETRRVAAGVAAGSFVTTKELRRGDSYRVRFHAPRPSRAQLYHAGTAGLGARARELTLRVPRSAAFPVKPRTGPGPIQRDRLPDADIAFPPFGAAPRAAAVYPTLGRSGSGAAALRRSAYARSWALAQRLRQDARMPLDYVLAVTAYLERGFIYTERPPRPAPGRATLDAFLFDSRAGYCQHFSAAMALLLRMGGIPARVATGFTPGEFRRSEDEWVVRDIDAHSWVEAWFSGIGWVTFDPTPSLSPARSRIAAIRAPDEAGSGSAEPSSTTDTQRGRAVRRQNQDGAELGTGTASRDAHGFTWQLALAAVLLLLGAGVWRRRRLAGRSPETVLDHAIAELQVALRRSGHPAANGITLAQVERDLRLEGEAAAYVSSLRAGRYGRAGRPPTLAQRRALRRQLVEGLGLRGRWRGFWALPPWRYVGGRARELPGPPD